MARAPDHIVNAVCETIHRATVYCRNYTCQESASIKQVNELMDAIHAVPMMIYHWDENMLEVIKMHLGCFDSSRWEGAPDLVAYLEDVLEQADKPTL